MVPCCLSNLSFNVEVPEEDEIQIVVNGNCIAIEENQPQSSFLPDGHSSSAGTKTLLKTGNGEYCKSHFELFEWYFMLLDPFPKDF